MACNAPSRLFFLVTCCLQFSCNNTFRSVVLVPDEAEDMWHAYNLIAIGDHLRSTTIR